MNTRTRDSWQSAPSSAPEHDSEADAVDDSVAIFFDEWSRAHHTDASRIRAILAPRTWRERVAARIESAGVRIGAALVELAEAVRGGL